MALQEKILIRIVCLGMSLKFILEHATKYQKGSRGIDLLFL
jgi:hypothetical protein